MNEPYAPMTCADFYAAARGMGLRPSTVPGVWLDRNGQTRSLPDPEPLSPLNRALTIKAIRQHYDL